jgi:hypothetical protein
VRPLFLVQGGYFSPPPKQAGATRTTHQGGNAGMASLAPRNFKCLTGQSLEQDI